MQINTCQTKLQALESNSVNPVNISLENHVKLNLINFLITLVLIFAGLLGIFLPVLPGVPLVFLGLLFLAWVDQYDHVGWPTLLVMAFITLASLIIDFVASIYGAHRVGASRMAIWGALIGTCIGALFLPIGLLVGPFLGAWLGEYWHGQTIGKATQVGIHTWVGLALGCLAKLALSLGMIGLFVAAWFL